MLPTATWQQKLAADFPSLKLTLSVIQLSTVHFIEMEQHTLLSAYKNL
jgi:hypothetical protein